MTELKLDMLRASARRLQRAHSAQEPWALETVRQHDLRRAPEAMKRADFLHIVARQHGFASWPALKASADLMGLDRAARLQRLRMALFHGQHSVVERLLEADPALTDGQFCMQVALYDRAGVLAGLARDPALATTPDGPRRPILHLAFSKWIKARPELAPDMLAIAEALLQHGADVNDSFPHEPGSDHRLSALYGAIGHADNMALGQWILDHGANPNDGESLYHATELGHHDGLRMLIAAGADPNGTNALLRAMDFHDHEAVKLLLAAGARADDFNAAEVGGESPWVVPALHQAARRGSDRDMADLLLEAGASPRRLWKGTTPYAFARVHGNRAVAEAIAAHGATTALTEEERLLARAADGESVPGDRVDPQRLAPAYADLIREILHLPGRLPHVQRLVTLGLSFDKPDDQGLTPVQIAGWEGLPEVMAYFLSLGPDLSHVNGYGGTLLSTILHGSENNPSKEGREYVACLERALEQGVPLPRQVIGFAGREDTRAFLEDWAEANPAQVV